jgi:DNA-binding MarR family transcriptional regulator
MWLTMTKTARATTGGSLGTALEFLRSLGQLNHALEQLSSRMERILGVTAKQRLIVRCIGKFHALTAGQLADLLHVDPGTVSAALKRLESKALLERRRDPNDLRRAWLSLTTKGRKLDRRSPGTVEEGVERLLHASTGEDIATTMRVLEQLAALLGAPPH